MTFGWKKKTRFSQLVADHLQSPKRGGSLVVETGFPTSLIDLYVRNCGRFRKFSDKKRRGGDSASPLSADSSMDSGYEVSDEIIEDDVVGNVNVGVNCVVSSASEIEEEGGVEISMSEIEEEGGLDIANSSEIVEERGVGIGNLGKIDEKRGTEIAKLSKIDEESGVEIVNLSRKEEERGVERLDSSEIKEQMGVEIAKSNSVLVVVLKLLFMVVLALGTKRLTVGITVAAFLLFFLESVGKPLMCRLSIITSGCDPKKSFESCLHETKNITSSKEKLSLVVCNEVVEVKEVESKEEVIAGKEIDEVRCEVNYKSSRRAKMRSKMKKLVPKKLRTSKKCFLDSKSENSSGFKEEESVELDQDRKPQSRSLVISNESSRSKEETKHEHEKIVVVERQSLSCGMDCNDKELGTEMQENSGYLVLCLVVLVGLVVGRILALVLALSWCLILKKTQRRTVKVLIS